MAEFTFDGISPTIRSILDDSFRRGQPSYDESELSRFIIPIEFDRDLTTNLIGFRQLLEAAMKQTEFRKERSKSDGWLSPRIHNVLRLTRREAARKEFWIGLIFQNLDYLWWRFEVKRKNPLGLDRVLGSDSRMALAQLWWAAELVSQTDYDLISVAANSSNLGMYYQPLNLFHSKPIAVSLCEASFRDNANNYSTIEISKKLNLSINCFVRDDIAQSPEIDVKALRNWIREKPDINRLLAGESIPELPYSKLNPQELQEMYEFIRFLALESED